MEFTMKAQFSNHRTEKGLTSLFLFLKKFNNWNVYTIWTWIQFQRKISIKNANNHRRVTLWGYFSVISDATIGDGGGAALLLLAVVVRFININNEHIIDDIRLNNLSCLHCIIYINVNLHNWTARCRVRRSLTIWKCAAVCAKSSRLAVRRSGLLLCAR